MHQNMIELSQYRAQNQPAPCPSARRYKEDTLLRLLTAVEALVTGIIGLCILFCLGLTVSML